MVRFIRADYVDLFGVTPICRVQDSDIWRYLVSPRTKQILGAIQQVKNPIVSDSRQGLFPQQELSNLNDHRMHGGKYGDKVVRFPFSTNMYECENGLFVVMRDGVKFEALGYAGDWKNGKAELCMKVALRDRRFDGTPRANDCALLDFPYSDPKWCRPLSPKLKSVELSIYGFVPGTRLRETKFGGDAEYNEFVRQPFAFLKDPQKFLGYFKQAWHSPRAPGQNALPTDDVAHFVLPGFELLAKRAGYDFIELCPSHYHVARWVMKAGYTPTEPRHTQVMKDFETHFANLAANGQKLRRAHESWVCVLQSLKPQSLIDPAFNFNGPIWPQDNIAPENLWMYKALSRRGAAYKVPALDVQSTSGT